jgi:hypothetical protein
MLDYMCREIKVGDTIVYPIRRSSLLYMQRMDVRTINEDHVKVSGNNPNGRLVTIEHPERCVIVTRNGKDITMLDEEN